MLLATRGESMAIECPKCHFDNPDGTIYCRKCTAPLQPDQPSPTRTMQMPSLELSAGQVFAGRYEVIEELGRGGMGRVYKVTDTQINEEMALKLLKPEIAADEGMIERFRNELKIARKITHKHVCRMHDINQEEGTPFITMEYVEGEDLKSLVKSKGKLAEKEVIAIAKQVCEGLEEAHELGVVHRDLKPQNIMIDEKGRAKIMDFGIARSVEAPGVTQTGMIIGTPDYISPEQAEGKDADQRSDIYALGVILFEMVTGSVPFHGESALSVALKHKSQLPLDPRKLNPDVSESMSRLILVCLEKDKERRYKSAGELLDDLRNIEEGFPLGTKIRPRKETFIGILKRKKLFVPAVIIALAIVAIAVWLLIPERDGGLSSGSGKPSLAVVYFENNTGDEGLDYLRKMFPDLITTDLSESKLIEVLPGDRLFKILKDMDQLEAESYASDVLREIATRGGVENIVRGSFSKAGNVFRINISLQNARTGEQRGADTVEGEGEESFFSIVDELTPAIKGFFGLSAEEIAADKDRGIEAITTSSPEAYRYFIEGSENFFNGDFEGTIQLMEKAVSEDPEFASAYRWLAWAYNELVDKSAFKENIQRAYELSERLPERERLRIEGDYYVSSERTYDKAIAAYERYLELNPDDLFVPALLGFTYNNLEEFEKAEERLKVLSENNAGFYGVHGNLAMAYQAMGKYDEAKKILENYLDNISEHTSIRCWLAQNYILQREYEAALAEGEIVASTEKYVYYSVWAKGYAYECQGDLIQAENEFNKIKQRKDVASQIFAKAEFSNLFLLQGKMSESIDLIKQTVALAETAGSKWEESSYRASLVKLYLKSGSPEKALAASEKAFETAVQEDDHYLQRAALYFRGIAYLEMKDINSAQKTAEDLREFLESGFNKRAFRFYYSLMGQIELARDNFARAVDYLEQALSLSPYPSIRDFVYIHKHKTLILDPLALAYYRAGELEKASETYEKISQLTSANICYEGDTYVKSFYMLGKIHEQQGNTAKAIEHYDKFLDLWKDADPGIAEIEDAKSRLAKLQSP
jgi:serine/threonine protein kinase/predicted Zn-dependent protease